MTETIQYLIYGGGQWMDRWTCTGNDLPLMLFSMFSCLLMFGHYVVYAIKNHQTLKYVKESHFRQHLLELRNVFVVCGTIHLISTVFCWFFPVYYIISALMLFNTLQMVWLLRSKKETLAIQQHTAGLQATEMIVDIKKIVYEVHAENLKDTLTKLEDLFTGADTATIQKNEES